MRIEALPRGAGFEFVDAVVGGAIRGNLLAVEKGVRQVLKLGRWQVIPCKMCE
ncbi:MAG: hypothetical protein R3E08_06345 [Thiotrichaceae bacterium]